MCLPILYRELAEEGARYSLQGLHTFLFMAVARSVGPSLAGVMLARRPQSEALAN